MIRRTHLRSWAPLGGMGLGLLAVTLWSASTVAEKVLLREFPPVTLLVWQLSSSVALLWGLVGGLRLPLVHRRDLLRLGWPGLVQPGLANLLLLSGLTLTDASVFSLLNALEAPLGLVFAYLLLNEQLRRSALVLAGLATLGVLLVALNSPDGGHQTTLQGALLVLGGTSFAALYGSVSRGSGAAHDAHPLVLTAVQQSAALAVILLVWGLLRWTGGERLPVIGAASWGWAALAGIFQYALPFWLFLLALRTVSVSRVSLLFTLGPVLVLISAFLILGEELSVLQGCGAGLTLLALVGAGLSSRSA